MPIQITISGTTYEVPVQGDPPPNGTELTDVIVAIAAAATASSGPGDILPSTFSVANNVTTPQPVAGLIFAQGSVRGAEISYSVSRSTSTTEVEENGKLFINYDTTTNTWNQSQFSNGDAGITFTVVNGQVYYTTTNMTGSSPTGKMGFRATAFSQ